jgi:nucleoid-associated protein YgaU
MGLLDRLRGKKPAAAPAMHSIRYRTGINETPRSIARKFYGDEYRWELVWQTNLRVLKDEVQGRDDVILAGTELEIPDPKYDLDGKPIAA